MIHSNEDASISRIFIDMVLRMGLKMLVLCQVLSVLVFYQVVVFFLFHSEFLRALLTFPKPVVAAVNGQAVGFGVGILPLCDIVYASDKAMFYTPYTQLGQVPEAGLSCTLSRIIGDALVSHNDAVLVSH